jgi:hypothetical protein
MSKIEITGSTSLPKEILTHHLLDLVQGRLMTIREEKSGIIHDIEFYQKKFGFSNETFLEKWQMGQLGDDQDFFVWESSLSLLKKLNEEEVILREIL